VPAREPAIQQHDAVDKSWRSRTTYQNINYTSAAGSNAAILSQTDNISGETVAYADDHSTVYLGGRDLYAWSQTYGYDGFGT